MKFYVALDEAGKHFLETTQAKAQKINKTFETIEVPVQQEPLRDFIQTLLDQIDTLKGTINSLKHDASISPVTIEPAPAPQEPARDPQLVFRQQLQERWKDLPYGFRSDLLCEFMDEVRSILKPTPNAERP